MSVPQGEGKFSPQMRILVASLLSVVVMLVWLRFFAPKPPVQPPQASKPAVTAPSTSPSSSSPSTTTGTSSPSAKSAPAQAPVAAKSESQERTIVVENDLYRVEFSNRGAIVKSWQLKKYLDDAKPPKVLDLVHPDAARYSGGWPFALALDDEQLENAANTALYQTSSSPSLNAPADLSFIWSDGRLEVTKHFSFDHTYVVHVDTTVKLNGAPIPAGVAWRGGFGDLTVANPAPVETVTTFYSEDGKLTNFPYKKLEDLDKIGRGNWQGGKDWTGIEDRYFTAVFLPANGAAPGTLQTRYWKMWHPVQIEGKDVPEAIAEVATTTKASPVALRVYVGPKDYDDLKKMTPPLNSLVQFGWMEIIADPLFHGLKWLHKYIPNWGWAIVVLTLVINMLLFPMRISSYKTTMKMQRVAPEIRAIQDRYKKYSMRDPRKAEMNKEVMAVYQREGINPVGGCFQMLIQMPIWFGLNRAIQYAIELRHARWFGWITDLSSKDPYYILPIFMGLSMYLVSKMTPMTATDPQQQAMMKFMPLMMAGIFMVSPISSGLAVYILTSSLVGIGQQWYLNRTHPATPAEKPAKGKKGKKS